eukprot:gene31703-6908_t
MSTALGQTVDIGAVGKVNSLSWRELLEAAGLASHAAAADQAVVVIVGYVSGGMRGALGALPTPIWHLHCGAAMVLAEVRALSDPRELPCGLQGWEGSLGSGELF